MKKIAIVSGLTLGIIAGSSYLVGHTVDRHIDTFLTGMVSSAMKATGQLDAASLSVTVLKKKRHLFYTTIEAGISDDSHAHTDPLVISFDVHHGPFWFEKKANGDREFVSGLFGVHYDLPVFEEISVAINLRHHFLHSGKLEASLSGSVPGLTMDASLGADYQSHWNNKEFTLTDSSIHLDQVSGDYEGQPIFVDNALFEFSHPMGLLYMGDHMKLSASYQIDRIKSGPFSIDNLSLDGVLDTNKEGVLTSETSVTADSIGFQDMQGVANTIESLDISAKAVMPHYDAEALQSLHIEDKVKALQDVKLDIDASLSFNGEGVELAAELGLDVDDQYEFTENFIFAQLVDQALRGKASLKWETPCAENSEHTICQLVSAITMDLDENTYELSDRSFVVNLSGDMLDKQ